jgi:hypothetical protein
MAKWQIDVTNVHKTACLMPFGPKNRQCIRHECTLSNAQPFGYIAFLFNEINGLNHISSVAQRLL